MSLASFKAEFYPIPVGSSRYYEHIVRCVTQRDLRVATLAHSLRKWEGALPENLERHGGIVDYNILYFKDGYIEFDSYTCALCREFYRPNDGSTRRCNLCPLRSATDSCSAYGKPFGSFVKRGDPKPMINALRETLEKEERGYLVGEKT